MKAPLCSLLLLAALCPPGRSDCQGECLSCAILPSQQLAFSTLVCLLECEGQVSPSLTWELCQRALKLPQRSLPPAWGAVAQRTGPEKMAPVNLESELLYSAAMEDFQQAGDLERRSAQYDSSQLGSSEEGEGPGLEEREDTADSQGGDDTTPLDLTKRFGGFLKGRHGYRKLVGPSPRLLQKRYGGFLGIRKSARKLSTQKQMGQLLRQYLEMSRRSGRIGSRRQSRL